MGLTFEDSSITGVISASTAAWAVPGIGAEQFREIGVITNTVAAPINNGMVVTLAGDSEWTVTGTCYLTKLVIGADSTVQAPFRQGPQDVRRRQLTPIVPGQTYTGMIELQLCAT